MYITFHLLLLSTATFGPGIREETGGMISVHLGGFFFFFHFVVGRCSLRLDTEEWKMSFEITFLPLMVIASSHVITSYIFQKVQSTASKTPLAITSHSLFQQALSLSHCFFLYTSLPSPSCPPQDSFTPCLLL